MSDSQTPPVLDGLSPLEEAVIDAARRGTWTEPYIQLTPEQLADTDDPRLRVRAKLLRELLMGRRGELDPRGVLIQGVRVVGKLDLNYVTAVTGLVLNACALPDGVRCRSARLQRVFLTNCAVAANLYADGLRTDGDLLLEGTTITGTGEDGALRLLGAHIGGEANLTGTTVTNTTGPALVADTLRTDDTLFLVDASVTGSGEIAALRLAGIHIGGQANLTGATVTNTTGPAVNADYLYADGDLLLMGASITATSDFGALRLVGARIGGQLHLGDVSVANTTGPALVAHNLRADGDLLMTGASITATSDEGALRLVGARIGGQADMALAQLINGSGPLLVLTEAQVGAVLFLPAELVCPHARLDIRGQPCADRARQMQVRDLVFPRLDEISWREWLHLLVHHSPEYLPQPYQQLAAVERAAGHDTNARRVLIAQQDDLRRRAPEALGGWLARRRHWLWGWLGRYGYRAHRLVIALFIVLLLAGVTGYTAGQIPTRPGHHTAERVPSPTTPATAAGTRCSTAELIGLGIDRGLPLGTTGLRARCDLDTTTRRGQAFTYLLWALQALVWALATLTIAAYTGLIRKIA